MRMRLAAALVAALCLALPAFAQSTANPVLPGYQATDSTSCPGTITPCFVPYVGGNKSALNITANTVVKASPGRVFRVTVIAAPATTAVTINDATTTGGASAANTVLTIPVGASVGTVFYIDWPMANGIVVAGITTATLAISFN